MSTSTKSTKSAKVTSAKSKGTKPRKGAAAARVAPARALPRRVVFVATLNSDVTTYYKTLERIGEWADDMSCGGLGDLCLYETAEDLVSDLANGHERLGELSAEDDFQ
jgi:hypothetical protein